MKTSKNGLFLCRRGISGDPVRAGRRTQVYELPAPKRPPMVSQAKVFLAIIYLLFAVYTGIVIKDLVEGREPPVLDTGGAPRPCAPPSQGVWPDCHELAHK